MSHKIYDEPYLSQEDIDVLLPIFSYPYNKYDLKLVPSDRGRHNPDIYITNGESSTKVAEIKCVNVVDFNILYYDIETITGVKFELNFCYSKPRIIPVLDFCGLGYDINLFYRLDDKYKGKLEIIKQKGLIKEFLKLYNKYPMRRIFQELGLPF